MLEKRQNWRNRIALLCLILISVAVVVIHYKENEDGPLHRVQNSAMNLLSPLQAGAFSIVSTGKNLWESGTQFSRLKSENEKLSKEVANLRRETIVNKELELENQRLHELLDAPIRRDFETLFATVIGQSVNNWQATIVLDRGLDDGIKKNMAVANADGLVGQVKSVTRNACLVQLITDQKCSVGGRLQSNRATAIVEGEGSKELKLKFLSRDIELIKDDPVLTSGMGGVYPSGIVIGTISYVGTARGLYQEARISPAVDFWNLEEVFIITGEK